MTKSLKIVTCLLFLVGTLQMCLPVVFSQKETEEIVKEIRGKISVLDVDKSMLVISQLKSEQEQIYEDIVVLVDDSTYIEKDDAIAGFADLKVGDEAVIEYTVNEKGENVASYIWISE